MSGPVANDERAQIGLRQPTRHIVLEDAAANAVTLGEEVKRGAAFAGDDQHVVPALRMTCEQKTAQARMRFGLVHAMQIKARVDVDLACRQLAYLAPIKSGGRRLL
jgi:acyl-CoA hydrolase